MSIFYQDANESPMSSITSSPSQSVCHSPKSTPKNRKMKRAPPPPTSTPLDTKKSEGDGELALLSQIETGTDVSKPLQFRIGSEENLKSAKDEMNRNRQSASNLPLNDMPSSLPNKSTYGKWKRRKGQAPSRPIPQKRFVQSLPIEKIKHELDLIEIQQSGLEKQGVTLEKLIRERSEGPGANEDETLAPEVEDMVIQLFEIVNEKNELFRKQTELMYLRRQHRLEMEYAELEYQIRCLMLQPEANKTDSEKSKEEELTARLLENVERRNEIVDCLEMNRRREIDEDTSISDQMSMFSLQRNESTPASEELSKKEKNKSKKNKEKKSKKNKMDADKDIDESETQTVKIRRKRKIQYILK
ncbi:hypothetical protein HHI36_009005 [Cryptolaemus montrouzieri]|uniref:BMERB domain-containing protein n=1 Tax=Cryptolaemus montrouzieri TaxID=559131 RepID=A0ABD2MU69_9CUCU